MKPKIKDGVKLNLYVDRGIVAILGELASENNTSLSQYAERLIREAKQVADTIKDAQSNGIPFSVLCNMAIRRSGREIIQEAFEAKARAQGKFGEGASKLQPKPAVFAPVNYSGNYQIDSSLEEMLKRQEQKGSLKKAQKASKSPANHQS